MEVPDPATASPTYANAKPDSNGSDPEPTVTGPEACYADFYQPVTSGRYGNLFGIPTGLTPWGSWGRMGKPDVYHFNTGVDVAMQHRGEAHSDDYIRFPVGYNSVTWRAETLYSPFDFVPIYVPGKGFTTTKERIRLATWLGLKVGVGLVGNLVVRYPSGPYNTQPQSVQVWDVIPPTIDGPTGVVEIEAIEPGGVSSSIALANVRRQITTADACARPVDLTSSSLPSFLPVNDRVDVTWTASDRQIFRAR